MNTLSQAARKVKLGFSTLLSFISNHHTAARNVQVLQDEEQKFMLWAVNLGVFDAGHSSLDYRLQDVPEASDFVKELLNELGDHLVGLHDIKTDLVQDSEGRRDTSHDHFEAGAEISCSDDDSDSSNTDLDEVDAHILSVKDIIHRLYRLARSIRNYNTRSVQGRRNLYSTIPSDQRQIVKNQLIEIERTRVLDFIVQLRKQDYDGFVDSDEIIALDADDHALIERLARACSRRRQQFVYWRVRHERSLSSAAALDETLKEEKSRDNNLLDLQKPQWEAVVPGNRVARPQSIPSSVTRLRRDQIDISEMRSVASDVSRAPSARGPSGEKVIWPSVPNVLPRGEYFECPFCFNLCPTRYRSDLGWKAHLIHDLKPYCCTYPSCDSGDQMYDSWADWSTHEMLVHNRVWTCLEHRDIELSSLEEYRAHVNSHHLDEAQLMLTAEVVSARSTGSRHSNRDCPFCLIKVSEFQVLQRHVAWHLEGLALMALPKSTGYEQGSDDGDLRSNVQKADGFSSRAGDLEDTSLPQENDLETPYLKQMTEEITARVLQQLQEGTKSNIYNAPTTELVRDSYIKNPESEQVGKDEIDEVSLEEESFTEYDAPFYDIEWMMLKVARHLIDEYEPKNSIVISSYKMQKFYKENKVEREPYPWNWIMDNDTSSISRLFRELAVEHHLIQEVLSVRPDIPSLTPVGFVQWMKITAQIDPERERSRWEHLVRGPFGASMNLTATEKQLLNALNSSWSEVKEPFVMNKTLQSRFIVACETHCHISLERG